MGATAVSPFVRSWLSPKFKVGGIQDLQMELLRTCNDNRWENSSVSLSLRGSGGLSLSFKFFAGDSSSELKHTFDSVAPSVSMKFSSLHELRNHTDDTLRAGVEIIEAVNKQEQFGATVATRCGNGSR